MAENVKCKSCKRLKKHWCKAVLDSPDEDMLRDCRHFVQKTNADRIRAMSDEELAKFLECFGLCHHCTEHHRLGDLRIYADEKCDEMCEHHCLEWLQQPAEVDNG